MTQLRSYRYWLALCIAIGLSVAGCSHAPSTSSSAPSPAADDFAQAVPLESVTPPGGTFYTPPYLQLGDNPTDAGALALVWHAPGTSTANSDWLVETRSPISTGTWKAQAAFHASPVAMKGVAPHVVFTAKITGLEPGRPFDYRISKGGKPVFEARANRARPSDGQPFHIVLFGDDGAGTAAQKKIAYQASLAKPDAVVITGGIVYPSGRASEYRDHFFPVYNADTADAKTGAPLMRSTLFVGATGTSDLASANMTSYPDGLAYYYYWQQPKNGFSSTTARSDHPAITGNTTAFLKAAGGNYPHGANFSFDYGSAHVVVVDSSPTMDWSDTGLQKKLRTAIEARRDATWRFVVLHTAPFHSSQAHQDDQWMRVLCPLFAECHVDVVFSGHVHNYQRSFPLFFNPIEAREPTGKIHGKANIDNSFDGATHSALNGVLYVVSGAGGADLDRELYHTGSAAGAKLPFTSKVVADKHSFTLAKVDDHTLTIRQIDEDGSDVDLCTVTK